MKLNIYTVLMMLCIVAGCKKFVQVEIPPNQLVANNVFDSDQTAIAAFAGIYSEMSNLGYGLDAEVPIALSLGSDELKYAGTVDRYIQFEINNIQTDNLTVTDAWTRIYKTIYNVNSALDGLNKAKNITDKVKQQLIGEAKFLRSFCYFYLVNLFGDVPLNISPDYEINSKQARTEKDVIYSKIVEDLRDAIESLSENYPDNERLRPNRFSAMALLARVFLYLERWEEASHWSSSIIDSKHFNLSDIEKTFLKDSKETIWQLMPVMPTYNTNLGRLLVPTSKTSIPTYYLSSELLEVFEHSDKRIDNWIDKVTINDQGFRYPYKYKVQISSTISECLVVFRLGEQYLIRAEVRAHLGDLNGAIADLNFVRKRAEVNSYSKGMQLNEILEAIAKERQSELFMEWGHRWFDLKRTGKIDEVLGALKAKNWQSTDALWPIPLLQLEANPFLTQNEGY